MARHWLVLAVATLWVVAYGTRIEDADWLGVEPSRLRTAPTMATPRRRRLISVFRRGLSWLAAAVARGRFWQRLWLVPEPLPTPTTALTITYHSIMT